MLNKVPLGGSSEGLEGEIGKPYRRYYISLGDEQGLPVGFPRDVEGFHTALVKQLIAFFEVAVLTGGDYIAPFGFASLAAGGDMVIGQL